MPPLEYLHLVIQAALVLCGLAFLSQCAVFVYHFGLGLIRGENGITEGLLVLYVALLLLGGSIMVDGVLMQPCTPTVVATGAMRVMIVMAGIAGNHLLYFALRRAK